MGTGNNLSGVALRASRGGAFYAQVLMWNPEQLSQDLAVYTLPDGTVFGRPFGTQNGGVSFLPIEAQERNGELFLQLWFVVEGI